MEDGFGHSTGDMDTPQERCMEVGQAAAGAGAGAGKGEKVMYNRYKLRHEL